MEYAQSKHRTIPSFRILFNSHDLASSNPCEADCLMSADPQGLHPLNPLQQTTQHSVSTDPRIQDHDPGSLTATWAAYLDVSRALDGLCVLLKLLDQISAGLVDAPLHGDGVSAAGDSLEPEVDDLPG